MLTKKAQAEAERARADELVAFVAPAVKRPGLPWRVSEAVVVDACDREVATVPQTLGRGAQASHDLARSICRAVNAHEELVACLEGLCATPGSPERWKAARAMLARLKGGQGAV